MRADLWRGQEEGKIVAKKNMKKKKVIVPQDRLTLQPHLQQSSSGDPNCAARSCFYNRLNGFKEVWSSSLRPSLIYRHEISQERIAHSEVCLLASLFYVVL